MKAWKDYGAEGWYLNAMWKNKDKTCKETGNEKDVKMGNENRKYKQENEKREMIKGRNGGKRCKWRR